jgi:hypothetical protein
MNKYQNGKIYAIKSPNTDKIYIGSTTQKYLSSRLTQHKCVKSNISSKEIINCGDAYIELIEMYPCNNIMELNKREGEIFNLYNNKVNKTQAGRTQKECKRIQYIKNSYKINCSICNKEIVKHNLKKHITNMHKNV